MKQSIKNSFKKSYEINGILLVNKPLYDTSNKTLQKIKKIFKAKKAGHTGSLDPLATGMLPVCFGKATKICSYLLDSDKTYEVVAKLGESTDTGDREGKILNKSNCSSFSLEFINSVLKETIGESEQIPPMYSALKYNGERLYNLARRGKIVDQPPRKIKIKSIKLNYFYWPKLSFTVTCSKGTYIRTLVEDIAKYIGTYGHVWSLHRSSLEPFNKNKMFDPDFLEKSLLSNQYVIDNFILDIDQALKNIPSLYLSDDKAKKFLHGQSVYIKSNFFSGDSRIYTKDNSLLGIGALTKDCILKPKKVLQEFSIWS